MSGLVCSEGSDSDAVQSGRTSDRARARACVCVCVRAFCVCVCVLFRVFFVRSSNIYFLLFHMQDRSFLVAETQKVESTPILTMFYFIEPPVSSGSSN